MMDTLWSILVVYGVATMTLLRNFEILQVSLSFSISLYDPVSQLCEVTVNHRDLPTAAFKQRTGFNGIYYQVAYELELAFGSELVFKMAYQGTTYGSVRAHYV